MTDLRHTTTHTYTVVHYANPYLVCDTCGKRAEGFINDGSYRTYPCDHPAGISSLCPSWGPVDGCQCQQHLGHVPHETGGPSDD